MEVNRTFEVYVNSPYGKTLGLEFRLTSEPVGGGSGLGTLFRRRLRIRLFAIEDGKLNPIQMLFTLGHLQAFQLLEFLEEAAGGGSPEVLTPYARGNKKLTVSVVGEEVVLQGTGGGSVMEVPLDPLRTRMVLTYLRAWVPLLGSYEWVEECPAPQNSE